MKMKAISNKLIFKRSLYNLTKEYTFQFKTKFFMQVDVCSMGGPLSTIYLKFIWLEEKTMQLNLKIRYFIDILLMTVSITA